MSPCLSCTHCPVLSEDKIEINCLVLFYIQMVAKGKDASDLFPAVVKNVVSKNLEVRF